MKHAAIAVHSRGAVRLCDFMLIYLMEAVAFAANLLKCYDFHQRDGAVASVIPVIEVQTVLWNIFRNELVLLYISIDVSRMKSLTIFGSHLL